MESKHCKIIIMLLLSILLFFGAIEALRVTKTPRHSSVEQAETVTVQTSSGRLRGVRHQLSNNDSVLKFLSVPYAEAPVGQLRFKRPVLIEDRAQSEVDASKFGKTCPQHRHLTRFVSQLLNIDQEHQVSEDCLRINLFVPSSVQLTQPNEEGHQLASEQLPVIVWIPGEGFDFADARQFDGSHLAAMTQSIVVTVQYRVGIFGFLHAPDMNITGNMGVYDQLAALKWVKQNIAAFGGNPKRVTVMGRFSGSMSISAMLTAPNQEIIKSEGRTLFTRAALISGVAVDDWTIDSHQAERAAKVELAAIQNSFCTEAQVLAKDCLTQLTVDQLLQIAGYGWRLVADNELIGSLSPVEAARVNQVSPDLEGVLMGSTTMEGSLCLYRHMLNSKNNDYARLIEEDKLTTNDFYSIILDDSLTYFQYNLTKNNPIHTALEANVIAKQGLPLSLRDKYLDVCSSYMIKTHLNDLKRNLLAIDRDRLSFGAKPVEVFQYELKYKPTFSLAPNYIKTAAHGDDIPLLFGLIYNQDRAQINEMDLAITRKMMSLIGNFAHGNHPLLHKRSSTDAKLELEAVSLQSTDASDLSTEATFTRSSLLMLHAIWVAIGVVVCALPP